MIVWPRSLQLLSDALQKLLFYRLFQGVLPLPGEADRVDVAIGIAPNLSVQVESHDARAVRSKCFKPLLPGGVRRDDELLDTSFGRVDAFNRRRNFASYTNPGRGEPEYPHGAPG
ncbi:hypothetical protein XCR1_840135 [Xenorhabdus cabanillasii JM26]|uniref:Uncharacterized protein n=1 Tax=Xenorhabdus cabanillasii JM26 TaxID=1427517 RepID=W1JC30_9GAMM|nr:hypothetical protein XCR1_840135 [Xenorhabdus cabanillasii JM26]